ncbi:uncharacterized protein LOC129598998 [Paramacrobiotus metropolitanus]|uniref:uncharacterized protein LOC129598998 n=1 Tax=Paramacrobiotus metropolitanus TaxID=2943436 RepID=UPI0024457B03|nr:uncharacterized protein LOC129598998 [Paramacrobiotus metropolitanus]
MERTGRAHCLVRMIWIICCLLLQQASGMYDPALARMIVGNLLQCYQCQFDRSTNLCVEDMGINTTCTTGINFCQMGAQLKADGRNGLMNRDCATNVNDEDDIKLWSRLPPGAKYICENIFPAANNRPDRICICNTPLCNTLSWDEAMVQPLLPNGYSDADSPRVPTLGNNSYRNYFDFTTSKPPTTNDAANGTRTGSDSDTAASDSKGLSVGAIIGIVIGSLAFLCLLVAAAIYAYRRYHKKKKPVPMEENEEDAVGSHSSRTSVNAAGTAGNSAVKKTSSEKKTASSEKTATLSPPDGRDNTDRHKPKPLPEKSDKSETQVYTENKGGKMFWGETYQ